MTAKSLTAIKKSLQTSLSTQKIYSLLKERGVVEKRFRKSQKSDEIKSFWVIVDDNYGINVDNHFSNSTTPKFFESEIAELLESAES